MIQILLLVYTLQNCFADSTALLGKSPQIDVVSVGRRQISKLVLGTDHLGHLPEEEIRTILQTAVEMGVNTFDSSPIYLGSIEQFIAKWLAQNPDENLFLLSKLGFPIDLFYEGRGPVGSYRSRLNGSLDQITTSLASERPEAIRHAPDILLLHRDDEDFEKYLPVPRRQNSVRRIFSALQRQARRLDRPILGVSNWHPDRVTQLLKISSSPLIYSPYFSLFEMQGCPIYPGCRQVSHEDMMKPEFLAGATIMTHSPLGGFSIFDRAEPMWDRAEADALELERAGHPYLRNVHGALFNSTNRARYDRLLATLRRINLEHKTAFTPDQLMNAYVLAHPRTDLLAIGAISVGQLRRAAGALELAKLLSAADLHYLTHGCGGLIR